MMLSVAGGCWADGTTLSSRDDSSWGARDMGLQLRLNHASMIMTWCGGTRTFHNERHRPELGIVLVELGSIEFSE